MLLRMHNLNVSRRLCNGSHLIVLEHRYREPFVRVVNGIRGELDYTSIPRVWLETDPKTSLYPFRRPHFPVRAAVFRDDYEGPRTES